LMRIELGGAFADLLNEKGKGSGDNEMGYVERTLGFRTRGLDDWDLRLVISQSLICCCI
jgi:16S rRNA (cytosine967-C5)-methyltransferase